MPLPLYWCIEVHYDSEQGLDGLENFCTCCPLCQLYHMRCPLLGLLICLAVPSMNPKNWVRDPGVAEQQQPLGALQEIGTKPTIGDMSGLTRLGNPRCASQSTHGATHLRSIRRDQKQGSNKFTGLFCTPSPSLYNHVLCLFQVFGTRHLFLNF